MAIVGDVKRMSIPLSSSPRSKYRKWFLVHRLNGCFQRHAVLLCFVMSCRWWRGMDPNLYSTKLCMHSTAIWVFIRVPKSSQESLTLYSWLCPLMAMWHVISQHSQHFDHRLNILNQVMVIPLRLTNHAEKSYGVFPHSFPGLLTERQMRCYEASPKHSFEWILVVGRGDVEWENMETCSMNDGCSWMFDMGVSWNRDTPSQHPF